MGERTRKRKREFKDTAGIMEPGGEGFIYDPIFRIKLGTTPILKNFKVRSYLNFMASLPMKRNPATGYFEFAETPEEITALCKAYFFAAEPGALADSGYDQFRINKARHLLVQPVMNTQSNGLGINLYPTCNLSGITQVVPQNVYGRHSLVWDVAAVGAGATSVSVVATNDGAVGVAADVSAPCDVIVEILTGTALAPIWVEHTRLQFTAAGGKAQEIMYSASELRLKVTAAVTISASIYRKT